MKVKATFEIDEKTFEELKEQNLNSIDVHISWNFDTMWVEKCKKVNFLSLEPVSESSNDNYAFFDDEGIK